MKKTNLLVAVSIIAMLVIMAVESVLSMRQESPVCDEVSHHIATGYSFLKTKDFRLNSTSPPLTEILAALPLLLLDPKLPLDHPSWNKIDRVTFGFQFLFRANKNADQLVFWSRIPMVVLSLFCALLVFVFAKELYGIKAGLFAMFLFILCPNILAYSKLVTPDIGSTFFILLAQYRLYKLIKKLKTKNIFLAGITLGLAQASKLSALFLLPLFVLILIWKAVSEKKIRYIFVFASLIVISYSVVFLSYFCEIKPLLKNDIDVPEKIAYIEQGVNKVFKLPNDNIKKKVIDFAMNTPIPFATYIMNILAETNMVFVKNYGAFLMGKHSLAGWWYYYPIVFLLKTPIPMIILLMLAIFFFFKVKPSDKWAERIYCSFVLGFTAISLTTKLQLSVRYLLPMYPLLCIYTAKLVNVKIKKQVVLNLIIAGLSIWYVVDTVKIFPHYISYFNQFAEGPENGWRYLRDANIDYGQDLPSLSNYLKENNIKQIKLAYFGSADPEYYGISYENISDAEIITPLKTVYAISVNYLESVKWSNDFVPVAKAGYSIFIYDFRKAK